MFNKLKRYLARKLLPYAEAKPQIYEHTSLDVETLAYECKIERGNLAPESIIKKEIARGLAKELIPYIHFEMTKDIYTDSIRYRGAIRIAIDKESKNE